MSKSLFVINPRLTHSIRLSFCDSDLVRLKLSNTDMLIAEGAHIGMCELIVSLHITPGPGRFIVVR